MLGNFSSLGDKKRNTAEENREGIDGSKTERRYAVDTWSTTCGREFTLPIVDDKRSKILSLEFERFLN
jgi:hypothetical protein